MQFVGINKADAAANQQDLINRCSFPLLQDTNEVKAWDVHHHGHKDDFLIYGADGALVDYLPSGGPRVTNLSTPEGYTNVKNAVLAALGK